MNPQELRYAKTHEWVHLETDSAGDPIATVGISAFAVEALTDLVYIDLPETGRSVEPGDSISEIESVKAVSDIYSPVAGEIVSVNDNLPDNLEILSEDPYGPGWIVKIKVTSNAGQDELLDYAAYQKLCEEEH